MQGGRDLTPGGWLKEKFTCISIATRLAKCPNPLSFLASQLALWIFRLDPVPKIRVRLVALLHHQSAALFVAEIESPHGSAGAEEAVDGQ
jgi:hypothetical protein